MEPTKQLSLQDIEAWERRISEEISRKNQEFLGNEKLKVQTHSVTGKKIEEFVIGLVKDFPRGPVGWFIQSTITIFPQIEIKFDDLRPLLQEENPGNLFNTEIGKTVTITNLSNDIFGSFIDQPTKLDLLNIKIPKNFQLKPNEWTKEKVEEEGNATCINAPKTMGIIDIDPKLETTEITATVRFGTTETPNQTIKLKTRDRQNSVLVIPLSHLNMSAKIRYDGVVSLPNGKTFAIDEISPPQNLVLINSPYNYCLNFKAVFPGPSK